jgi:hypothetical protein
MKKSSGFWASLLEKHDSHPDVTPRTDFGEQKVILLIGVPLLLTCALIWWFFASR